jgi:glutamate-1-semialdehyde 2,1-aminomutase
MTKLHEQAPHLRDLARQVLPAGHFGNFASDLIIARGKGGRVWDIDGKEYVDFFIGSGPMLIGHAHPEVTAAVVEQLQYGTTYFLSNEPAIRLATEIVAAVPCAEQVRFTSTGTEADLYAMRLARAYRKRDKILKFEGGYHGMSDYALMSLYPAADSKPLVPHPDSAGIPKLVRDDIIIAPYNDIEATREIIHRHRDDLAGVIVEPMQRLIPPVPGFLQGLREITRELGIVLIFDEVVTGFRLAYGGGQEFYGVTPDVCTLGKVCGGGFPLAAIAGRAEIMRHFDRDKVKKGEFLIQIGTLNGNPVAAAAGLATLEVLKLPGAYARLFDIGRQLWSSLEVSLAKAGIPALVVGEPVLFDAYLTSRKEIHDYRSSLDVDPVASRRFLGLLLERGILKGAGKIYVSLAHDERDVAHCAQAFDEAARMAV